ncbi:MAG: group II intron maturase-specific domain-containing protein [Methylococcales bacterium]
MSLQAMVADLNPTLRGWFGYFKHTHRSTFRRLEGLLKATVCDWTGFLRRRLRAWLRKREKRPGFGRCHADNKRWPITFFAAAGLFTLFPAWQAEKHSR